MSSNIFHGVHIKIAGGTKSRGISKSWYVLNIIVTMSILQKRLRFELSALKIKMAVAET